MQHLDGSGAWLSYIQDARFLKVNVCVLIFMMIKRETMFLPHTLLFIMQLITTPVTFKIASVAQGNSSLMAMVMSTNHRQLHLNKHISTVCNI
jgi:hypothetical protein